MLKSQLNLSIPGKTFLLGEYLALSTGPSLVISHQPLLRFDFVVGDFEATIHPQSPAGKWYQKHKNEIGSLQINKQGTSQSLGGFGESTAQFLAIWLYARAVREKASTEMSPQVIVKCWTEYQELFTSDAKPSGADLINQISGGLTCWNPITCEVQRFEWPFADLHVQLFKTDQKIKTHEHLAQLQSQQIPHAELQEIMNGAIQAVQEKNSSLFLRQSACYTNVLKKAGLQSAKALELMELISQNQSVLSVRGCGALGADVMAVYTSSNETLDFSELGLTQVAKLPEQISSGPVWGWS
jgi:mevalonate kinase